MPSTLLVDGKLPSGLKLLFAGDSLTVDGGGLAYLEAYFKRHHPGLQMQILSAGRPDEPVTELAARLAPLLAETKPDWVVFACGMEDGGYGPFSEERFKVFQHGVTSIVQRAREHGCRVLAMTPPPFDSASWADRERLLPEGTGSYSKEAPFERYGEVVARYADWLRSDASPADGCLDIHGSLVSETNKMRKTDPAYPSGDGIRPGAQGQWVIARTLLNKLFNVIFERMPQEEALVRTPFGDNGTQLTFYLLGRECTLLVPERPAEGNPWVWRTEFLTAFNQADLELLRQGWHIAYIRLSNLYGSPASVKEMRAFKTSLEREYGLAPQASLFGMSRGGFYAIRYAEVYPEDVSSLYLDAPVIRLTSWPGGLETGDGSPVEWLDCLAVYGLDEASASELEPLTAASLDALEASDIPVILVAGLADTAVPYAENGALVAERLERRVRRPGMELEGRNAFCAILKEGVGHHPHSLEDPAPIVEFVQQAFVRSQRRGSPAAR